MARAQGGPALRVGHSTFTTQEAVTAHARALFIDVLNRERPQIAADLEARALTLYREAGRPWSVRRVLLSREGAWPELVPLRLALTAWGDRWNLRDPWCMELALASLSGMDRYGVTALALPDGPAPFMAEPIAHPPYDPTGWSTREQAEEAYREYMNAVEAAAQAEGLVPSRLMLPQLGRPAAAAFLWAVRWQIDGEPASHIGPRPGAGRPLTSQSITEAVRGVLDMVGLTRRTQGRRGRPRKL